MKKKWFKGLVLIVFICIFTCKKPQGVAADGWVFNQQAWKYQLTDQAFVKNSWKSINGKWYRFNEAGYMMTGWFLENGNWYYLDLDGEMQTGWIWERNSWYYLKADGKMQTGWLQDGETWYCLGTNGRLQTGWLKYNEAWYYLGANGKMQTGWLEYNEAWYYLGTNGKMQTGWLKYNEAWYYLSTNGKMQTGWIKHQNSWYYLDSNGSMYRNWWKGNYYLKDDGSMAVSQYTPDGYFVDETGLYRLDFLWIFQKGQEVQHKYFTFTIPTEWNNTYSYREVERPYLGYQMWAICYNKYLNIDGRNNTYDYFNIVRCTSIEGRAQALKEVNFVKELGASNSATYFLAAPIQSNLSIFQQDWQDHILYLENFYEQIVNSIITRN